MVQVRRKKRTAPQQKTPAQKELRRLCGGAPPPWVERQVLDILNDLITHPKQLRCPPCENVPPAEVVRLSRKLDELLNTPPVDEDRAREMALHLAELQLNAIGPEEYETERLQRLFQTHSPMSELNQELLHESVRQITYADRRVTILLKNHQTIPGVYTPESYGKHMIKEFRGSGLSLNLDGFCDYTGIGLQQMEQEQGAFTIRGYVTYHGALTLDELVQMDSADQHQGAQDESIGMKGLS